MKFSTYDVNQVYIGNDNTPIVDDYRVERKNNNS